MYSGNVSIYEKKKKTLHNNLPYQRTTDEISKLSSLEF
jgi:hypothetical protein